MTKKCVECGYGRPQFEDPREVVLGDDKCLCADCAAAAYNDAIADAEEEIRSLKAQAEKAGIRL